MADGDLTSLGAGSNTGTTTVQDIDPEASLYTEPLSSEWTSGPTDDSEIGEVLEPEIVISHVDIPVAYQPQQAITIRRSSTARHPGVSSPVGSTVWAIPTLAAGALADMGDVDAPATPPAVTAVPPQSPTPESTAASTSSSGTDPILAPSTPNPPSTAITVSEVGDVPRPASSEIGTRYVAIPAGRAGEVVVAVHGSPPRIDYWSTVLSDRWQFRVVSDRADTVVRSSSATSRRRPGRR